jgi:quercetin dioxygenase-like cupin family protein
MEAVNAISKVRFASAKPQRVQLKHEKQLTGDLICMEPGQELSVDSGEWIYYVVTGTAEFRAGQNVVEVPTGQVASVEPDESHTIVCTGEQRLVCIAVGRKV